MFLFLHRFARLPFSASTSLLAKIQSPQPASFPRAIRPVFFSPPAARHFSEDGMALENDGAALSEAELLLCVSTGNANVLRKLQERGKLGSVACINSSFAYSWNKEEDSVSDGDGSDELSLASALLGPQLCPMPFRLTVPPIRSMFADDACTGHCSWKWTHRSGRSFAVAPFHRRQPPR